jgi:hypothetical protein
MGFFYVKDSNALRVLVNHQCVQRIVQRPEQGLLLVFDGGESLTIQAGAESERVWKMFVAELPHDARTRLEREGEDQPVGTVDFVSSGEKQSFAKLDKF